MIGCGVVVLVVVVVGLLQLCSGFNYEAPKRCRAEFKVKQNEEARGVSRSDWLPLSDTFPVEMHHPRKASDFTSPQSLFVGASSEDGLTSRLSTPILQV